MAGVPQGITNPPVHAADVDARNEELHAPGRGILGPGARHAGAGRSSSSRPSSLYFFVNWKVLSFVWKIG